MLKIIFGQARSGKTYTLTTCLTESLQSGNSDVVLIVPEQYSFQSERDILQNIDPRYISRIKTLSFTRLLDEVGRECGGIAGKRINSGIRTIMVSRAIETVAHDLIAFAKQTKSAKFASSVAASIVEFKQAGISADRLAQTSDEMADSRLKWKLRDISLIMSAYDSLISRLFIDPADDMNRLSNMLSRQKWFEGKEVFIDCFKGFTKGEIEVLGRILNSAANVTITLPCDSEIDEDEGAGLFSNVRKTAADIIKIAQEAKIQVEKIYLKGSRYENEEMVMLEKHLFSGERASFEGESPNIGICRADYPSDEMNFAARTIKKLVREEGYRFRDFVIIARDADKYSKIVERAMNCYGVPCHIDSRANAENQMVMVFALAAIEAAFGFNTEAIFRWLKTGLVGYSAKDISLLENYTYIWNINGKDWLDPWVQSPYGLDNKQPADAGEKLCELEKMRAEIVAVLQGFASAFRGDALSRAKAVYNLGLKCKLPERLAEAYSSLQKADNTAADILRQSYTVFMEVLSDIAECYGSAEISRETFVSAFKIAMAEYEIGTIPMGIDQVVFGSADHIRTNRPKVAFVLGINQDVFPASIKGDGLISVRERKVMIDLQLPVSDRLMETAVDEKFIFYSAATCASRKVWFSYCQADLNSEKLELSPYIRRIKDLFPNSTEYIEGTAGEKDIHSVESICSARNIYADTFNDNSVFSASLQKYFEEYSADAPINERPVSQSASLSPRIAQRLYGNDIYLSATKVDRFFSCPFSYFCKFGIRAKKIERAEMNALQRGSMVHYILENVLRKYGKNLSSLSPKDISCAADEFADEYVASLSASEIQDYRWSIMVKQVKELTAILCQEMAAQLADSDFEPAGFEITLQKDGDIEPVELPIGDGGKVVLGGQVDRVDAWKKDENQYVCVVDYKTGSKKFNLPDLLYGLNMQMLLYLYSAVKGAKGRFSGANPAGILYIPSERNIDNSGERTNAYSGILLSDADMLDAMDHSHSGRYIPIKYKKSGELSSTAAQLTFDKDEFELLFKNAESKLIEMGRELHCGNISIDPTDGADTNANACKYCDFRAVCKREKDMENRKVGKLKKEEIMEMLRGEENG